MKKILLLSLIASYSYGQSTLLTPGKAEVKADQIIIGNLYNPEDSIKAKLVVIGSKKRPSPFNHSTGAIFSSFATGLNSNNPQAVGLHSEFRSPLQSVFEPLIEVDIPFKRYTVGSIGAKISFNEPQERHTGVDIESILSESPEKKGINMYLSNQTNYSSIRGVRTSILNEGNYATLIGSSISIKNYSMQNSNLYGSDISIETPGACYCIGQKTIIDRPSTSTGIATGFIFEINGSDNSNIGQNIGGIISSTVVGSEKNIGLEITASGAIAENTGLKVTAGGTSISRAAIFNGKIENNGFTRLGTAAPFIQQKEIIGTMPAANVSQSFPHALTDANIMSVSILVNVSGQFIPPNYTGTATLEYNYYIAAGNIIILNKNGNSAALAGVPFKALITYKE